MMMSAEESYKLLRKHGIETAGYGIARSVMEAELIAEQLGDKLFMKIDSQEIIHKTEGGFVKKVYSKDQVMAVFNAIMAKASRITKDINGIIIQESLDGYEAILGMKNDEQFGPIILFGSGGIMAELIKDSSIRLVPLTEKDAEEMMLETKFSKLLDFRGKKIDAKEIIKTIMKFSELIQKNPQIKEIDINPLFISENKIAAADVRIII